MVGFIFSVNIKEKCNLNFLARFQLYGCFFPALFLLSSIKLQHKLNLTSIKPNFIYIFLFIML